MNTEDFQFFIRVADLGSISKAAQDANISVSVASQKLQRLEQQLQLRLFHRTTRTLTLTEEGRSLLTHGRSWLADFVNLHESLKVKDHILSGTLRMTASAIFGTKILMPVIAKFALLHPELNIHLDLNDQNIDLIQQGMDLAIRIGQLQSSSLIARQLSSNPRLLCASPAYLQYYGIPESLSDLKAHRCILQQHANGLTDQWYFLNKVEETEQIRVEGYFSSNSGEAIRQAALQGLGISNHSLWHVAEDLNTGKLVQVLPDFPVQATAIYAVFPHRDLVPPKVQCFLDYLSDYFQQHADWQIKT
ncbi:MAG: substrate binding domain-containing protein [Acinetobacter sp.]|jgi:DNA-binding transcriptional LysR family regulator|uniref:substrate binding domain-containing protein n=1 Tax=Acinetobacter sp. TaxID=472 RepID=UPI002821E7C6|nr:substrate binding domain-containing protein [Acinetobacter sp.]MDR2059999.1 substrate binding domain-containing protein [Acinetobacter sp.]